MYLFDTDTVSNVMRKTPSPSLLQKLAQIASEDQFVSTITVGEIVYGAYRKANPQHYLNLLQQLWPNVTILSFDEDSAYVYGEIRAQMEQVGHVIGEPDLRIAAIALNHDFTIVTHNVAHFSQVPGIKVEDWF